MSKQLRGSIILLITAFIWGSAFVAQSAGMEYVGPLTYTTVRSYIAVIALLPVVWMFSRQRASGGQTAPDIKLTVKAGICSGFFLSLASTAQQYGVAMTSAGKAGFITAIYIVLVPVANLLLFKKKIGINILISVIIAMIGFYMLSIMGKAETGIALGDLLLLLCALLFTGQILAINAFTEGNIDPVLMSFIQFMFVAVLLTGPMLIFEGFDPAAIWNAKITILYAGVMSSGVAYTLQIFGQRDCDPTIATLIMSLESVFAAVSGAVLLHERMTGIEWTGCAFVFAAVLLAQITPKKNRFM